jgi:aminoglycoside phosphotransferase (APT) family kinase protein
MENQHWLDLAAVACDHADINYNTIETLATWDQEHHENAVYRLDGQRMLKLYGPPLDWRFSTERAVLRLLADHPAIPAPRLVAAAERPEEWPYLVMTAVAGVPMDAAWKRMSHCEQLAIARSIGAMMAALHHLPQAALTAVAQPVAGRNEQRIRLEEARRSAEIIEATVTLSVPQRDALLRFLHEEALMHLNGPSTLTHFDLSHHHVYLAQNKGSWQVTGIIDWADAVLGPPEWDIVCLWHWTFNGVWHNTFTPEWEAMQVCLQTLFAGQHLPERFARRCLAAHLHTPWLSLLWPHFVAQAASSQDIVRDLTAYLFTPAVFGAPD